MKHLVNSAGLSRRGVLGAGLGLAATSLLAACGGGSGTSTAAAKGATGVARKGGTLRIGRPPASSAETLDPASSLSAYEYLGALYNRLVKSGADGSSQPDLAQSWESDKTASTWTFHLRQGVTFHDGKAFTSKDAAYTIQHMLDKKTASPQAGVLSGFVDPAGLRTPDDHTLVVTLKQPHAEFPSLLTNYNCYVIPDGSAATIGRTGIGTGPFKLQSFTAAGKGVVVANKSYYEGAPNLDQIVFSSIADQQARLNALLADQVDLLAQTALDYASSKTVLASSKLTVVANKNATVNVLPMLSTAAPFTDVRVRQALKLAYDPASVLTTAAQGKGVVGHDNPVLPTDANYLNYSVTPDPGKAKSLLKAAGHEGLQIKLYTSSYQAGFTPLALAFADSVKQAGITANVTNAPADSYYTQVWMKRPLSVSYWYTGRPIDQLLGQFFLSGSDYNETAWKNPRFDGLIAAARKETDAAKRRALYQDAQKLGIDEGGLIVPFFSDRLTGMSKNVVNYAEHGFEFDYVHIGLKA
ncbi:MAG: peptide transporter binding protein [Actinomycetia bacterium]|nr:peptide transporter binding protein [Actinomycetes bacterium]